MIHTKNAAQLKDAPGWLVELTFWVVACASIMTKSKTLLIN